MANAPKPIIVALIGGLVLGAALAGAVNWFGHADRRLVCRAEAERTFDGRYSALARAAHDAEQFAAMVPLLQRDVRKRLQLCVAGANMETVFERDADAAGDYIRFAVALDVAGHAR